VVIVTPRDNHRHRRAVGDTPRHHAQAGRAAARDRHPLRANDTCADGRLKIVNIYNGDVHVIVDLAMLTYATPRAPDDALTMLLRAAGIAVIPPLCACAAGNVIRHSERTCSG
jgi:hypothetical protein